MFKQSSSSGERRQSGFSKPNSANSTPTGDDPLAVQPFEHPAPLEDKPQHHAQVISIGPLKLKIPNLTKKQWILVGVCSAIITLLVGFTAWQLFKPRPTPAPVVVQPEPEPEPPATLPSPLTGVEVEPSLAELPVTAVIIENSPEARPQAGLGTAGVVFEAIAEGGITRFLALYQEDRPDPIGPIRSVRPYFLDWAMGFKAPIAHVGGSADALAQIRRQNLPDLDQFANPGAYYRSPQRYAPHNMYSSRGRLLEIHERRGYQTSQFNPWPRKDDNPLDTPGAKTINFNISSSLYNPSFNYHANSNSYRRVMNGRPHIDEQNNQQISPDVVIGLVAPRRLHPNGVNTVYDSTGQGEAVIFQDGRAIGATWRKANRQAMLTFVDSEGQPIELNRGRTWISVVDNRGAISYSP